MRVFFVILMLAAAGAAWYFLPASHHRAATGTYFAREYISFTTPNGVTGWPPSQEIREVLKASYAEGRKTVTDGTYVADVPETALTQDVEDAEATQLAETTHQAQVQSNLAAMKVRHNAQEHSAQLAAADHIDVANAQQVAASTIGMYNSRLYEPTRSVGHGSSATYYGYATTNVIIPPRPPLNRSVVIYDQSRRYSPASQSTPSQTTPHWDASTAGR